MCSAISQFFPPVSPRSPGEESEFGLVSLSFLKCRIVQPSFKCFLIKSSVAFVASVRKGGERGFWARAGSARGSRAVSRPNSLPSPFPVGGGGVLPYKKLIGKYRWRGSHFHDWSRTIMGSHFQ